MLELILTAINAKLAMLNKLANLYCLAERRPIEGGKTVPYAYRGGRDLQPINIDSGSVGYWRINGEGSDEYINDPYVAGQQRQVTWPLRFYAMAHRDSQFTASTLADLIGATITDADTDVAQLLDMEDVSITVSGRDLDTTSLYGSEFDELDLPYHLAFIALTVTVTIRGSANCFPDPCDIDTDILHSFNFCDAATRARLTDEQVACLEAALCETPPTLCEQLAEVLPADVVTDVFDCLTPEAQAELLDSECVIPPCDPVNVIVNGDAIGTPASGTNFTLAVELDGIEAGSYNGAGVWEVTSQPCPTPSITVAASSATPAFGSSVTLTATASNFTPSSYTWYANGVQIGTGASLVWTVSKAWAVTVVCVATDGSVTARGTVSLTVSTTPVSVISLDGVNDGCAFNVSNMDDSAGLVFRIRYYPDTSSSSCPMALFQNNNVYGDVIRVYMTATQIVVYVWTSTGYITQTITYTAAAWNELVVCRNVGTGTRIYHNGALVYSNTAGNVRLTGFVGALGQTIYGNSKMKVKCISIWKGYTSTDAHIAALYAQADSAEPSIPGCTLVEHWPLMEANQVPITVSPQTTAHGVVNNSPLLFNTNFASPYGLVAP